MKLLLLLLSITFIGCKSKELSFADYKEKRSLSESDINNIEDSVFHLASEGLIVLAKGDTASVVKAVKINTELDNWINLIGRTNKENLNQSEIVLKFREQFVYSLLRIHHDADQ